MSSECSSGCQSGWTMYLVQSSGEHDSLYYKDGSSFHGGEEEEEEDLSMISDASSGPPQLPEDDGHGYGYHQSNTCFQSNGYLYPVLAPTPTLGRDGGKKRRAEAEQQKQHSSVLDDTASSQLLTNSKDSFNDCNNHMKQSMEGFVDFSYAFSTTNFKAKSALQEQMDYSQSFPCVKPTPSRPVKGYQGKREGKRCGDWFPCSLF